MQVNTKLPGGCHKGELTLVGQRQAHALGVWLRQRYLDCFGLLDGHSQVTVPCVYDVHSPVCR